jgi:hypothetical protein
MPALVAGIHVFGARVALKTWMAGTSPAMTVLDGAIAPTFWLAAEWRMNAPSMRRSKSIG